MTIDVNVRITADDNLVNALSDIAGCLAAVSMANAGNADAHLPEKAVKPSASPANSAEKAKVDKDTKAKEEPLQGKPVNPAKAKEINDLVKEPEPKKAEDEDKPNTEEIEAIRGKAGAFMKADKAANQPKIAAWLKENSLKRVGEIETRAQMDSLKALIGGDKVA